MNHFFLKFCTVLLLFFSSIYCNAQKVFTKAYITFPNKDTLKGYIQEQGRYNLAKTIKFKADNNAQEVTYSINDINSFYLYDYDEMYLSRQVEIDKKPIATNDIETGSSKKIESERVLLGFLVKGKIDLLKYVDENRKQHFFYQTGKVIKELGYVKFIDKTGNVRELAEYYEQMKGLFSDCNDMAKMNPSYSENSLKKAFKNYNNCKQALTYIKGKEKMKVKLGVFVGAAFNQFTFSGADNFDGFSNGAATMKYSATINGVAGLAFDLLPSKKSVKTNLTADLFWKQAGAYTASNNVTDYFTTRKDYSIQYSFMGLNAGIKYFFVKNTKLSPFFRLSVGYRYLLSSNTSLETTLLNRSRTSEPLVDLSKSGFGITTSVGATIKRFQVEIGYDYTKFSSSQTRTDLSLNSPTATVGYRLTK